MEKFDNVSYTKEYTKSIRESNYVQEINKNTETIATKIISKPRYNSIEELIIYNYNYKSAIDEKSSLNLNSIKIDMASKIDEEQENYYNKFKL